ncbi:MAG: trypsin-like peptidase domain-containing protein [Stigonema ocellatum SAG 48.90 = DSM 106950]|nr:trypsin-like peptidase domain-containing protein [Stigonema ocellatum SAG 48.90 = DSM 106950]
MRFCWLNLRVCIGYFLSGVILIQTPHLTSYAQSSFKNVLPQLSSKELSQKQLCDVAKLFTVKVIQGNSWGSGILVQKQGRQYTLVTNGHVLTQEKEKYTVETHDGKKYEAFVLVRFDHVKLTGADLAILQFNSPTNYEVATLAKWTKGEKVMASGFASDATNSLFQRFMCTQVGQVSRRLEQSMQLGYQLGYFLSIRNGMSGGSLLNTQGKVVGINGMAEPAIFRNPDIYLYRNGSRVSESLGLPADKALDLLSNSSWAIPSEKFVELSHSTLNLTISSSNTSNVGNIPPEPIHK